MDNKSNSNTILDGALIVAGFTLWAWVIAYYHAAGYSIAFKIPVDFITFGNIELLFSSLWVVMVLAVPTYFVYPYLKENVDKCSQKYGEDIKKFITVLLMFLFSTIIALGLGYTRAYFMRTFFVIQDNPKLIIWYKSGDKFFCEKYDEAHKKLTGEMVFIDITKDLILKKEELGDIKVTR